MLTAFRALQSPILDIRVGWIISLCRHSPLPGTNSLSHCLSLQMLAWLPVCPSRQWNLHQQPMHRGALLRLQKLCAYHSPILSSIHLKARRKHWSSQLMANVIPIFKIPDAFEGNFSFKVSFWTLWLCEAHLHEWYLKITVNDLSPFMWTIHLSEKNKKTF